MMTISENTVSLHNQSVHYWEDGEQHERILLLLNGGIGDARLNLSASMPILAENYRVIAPDLPGFGQTTALPIMQVEPLLEWVKEFIDSLEIEHAVIIGHAFGGLLARLFVAAHPSYAVALVLVNGGTIPNIPPIMRLLARVPFLGRSLFYSLARSTVGPKELARLIYTKEVLTDDFLVQAQANISGFAQMMLLLAAHSIPEKRTPPVPTLLLWGANDEIVTLAEAEKIKSSIRDAALSPLADCGNMPHLEAPEVFAWQVVQFVTNLNRPSRPDLPGVGKLRD
jgi:pimeloyl-ACP methyl ester carboxylesterase